MASQASSAAIKLSQSWCTNLLHCFHVEVVPGSVPALGSQTSARCLTAGCGFSRGRLKMGRGRASMHSLSHSLVAPQDSVPAQTRLCALVPLHVVGKLGIFSPKAMR